MDDDGSAVNTNNTNNQQQQRQQTQVQNDSLLAEELNRYQLDISADEIAPSS